jgi:CheY-like chemotaxis protein
VVLDIMMPGMNGLDALRQIRATPSGQSLPVMVVTNAFIPQLVENAKSAGATWVFSKLSLTPSQLTDAFRLAVPATKAAASPAG